MAEKLISAIQLDKLRKSAVRHSDGGGLFLEVRKPPAASWTVRMQVAGRRRDFGLGSLDKVGLEAARTARDEIRHQFKAGLDPVAERVKANATTPTFRSVAVAMHKAQLGNWSNGKHRQQWIRTL
jgi:hypothetical protein